MARLLPLIFFVTFISSVNLIRAQEKAQIPQTILDEMTYLIGEWDLTHTEEGEEITGVYEARWAPGKQGLRLSIKTNFTSFGIATWDPKTGQMVENWYNSMSGRIVNRYTIDSNSKWSGTFDEHHPDGSESAGTIDVQKLNDHSLQATKIVNGKEKKITIRRRIKEAESPLAGLDALVGNWGAQSEDGNRRTSSFQWDDSRQFLNNQHNNVGSDGESRMTILGHIGWNEKNEQLTNWVYFGNGAPTSFIWERKGEHQWQARPEDGDARWDLIYRGDEYDWIFTSPSGESSKTVFRRQ